ncbi:hypothetical protein OHA37_39125 [Streptomyces sp. NBC_00335]|uniref:hypothetical protein n=1 Tax=unclassified Streptomyces TaxID=2593676 RepID=UPI0022508C48|nr:MULTISPECIES: hypothetical protein [unclassified Streptomyces]MCX5409845.1 hypothetical protein [Streptomyces sp. NBC_00086]
MPVELDFPEFPFEEPPGSINCLQKPWNGVLVVVDHIPFTTGDKVTFDVTVCSDTSGQTLAAKTQGVVSVTADTTSVSYTIPWVGVLDAVTEGSITVFYTLTPADGSTPSISQEAMVQYSRQQPGGTVCGPDT